MKNIMMLENETFLDPLKYFFSCLPGLVRLKLSMNVCGKVGCMDSGKLRMNNNIYFIQIYIFFIN